MSHVFKLVHAPVMAMLVLLYPVAATAQQAETQSLTVAAADLDLASPLGRATFDRRVTLAIGVVCGGFGEADLAMRQSQAACRAKARRDAQPQIAAVLESSQRRSANMLAAVQLSIAR